MKSSTAHSLGSSFAILTASWACLDFSMGNLRESQIEEDRSIEKLNHVSAKLESRIPSIPRIEPVTLWPYHAVLVGLGVLTFAFYEGGHRMRIREVIADLSKSGYGPLFTAKDLLLSALKGPNKVGLIVSQGHKPPRELEFFESLGQAFERIREMALDPSNTDLLVGCQRDLFEQLTLLVHEINGERPMSATILSNSQASVLDISLQ